VPGESLEHDTTIAARPWTMNAIAAVLPAAILMMNLQIARCVSVDAEQSLGERV
jgi:hypothetical protein